MKHSSRIQVLFLEDDADTQEMVTDVLRESDISVLSARTSDEALHLADTESFDAFLLDGMVPNGGSLRLCRIFKSRFPGIPTIFYIGDGHMAEIETAMAYGAATYLVKPARGDFAKLVGGWVRDATVRKNGSANSLLPKRTVL